MATTMALPDDPHARRLLLVVDAPSLLHRNHHARAHTRALDRAGRPVWALHGMLRQIIESIDGFAPDAVLFGLDDRTGSVRRDSYPAYKAGRAEKHPELVEQLERAGALLDALGMATLTPAGLEADDVNASGAAWARRHGWSCVIITSDRDAFAHISDHTKVLRLIDGGIHGSPLLDPARLRTMYGVAAENYLAYAALRGDASDNLPGVPGIGEKTAAALLEVAGSMRTAWPTSTTTRDARWRPAWTRGLSSAVGDGSGRASYATCRRPGRASATSSTCAS
jgi:5'-3' exonuclease